MIEKSLNNLLHSCKGKRYLNMWITILEGGSLCIKVKILGGKRTKILFVSCGFCAWRHQYFKVADFLASRARKTSTYARHPALPKRVNLPSLQEFLVFTKRTGNANGTILKHCMEEPNDAYITSSAAEKPPCSVSAVTPSSRESTFSLSPWQGPRPAAKMKEYFSSLHPPFAPNLSPSFRWWKASWQDILKSIREMRCHLSAANEC
jgi:hypothetical protein